MKKEIPSSPMGSHAFKSFEFDTHPFVEWIASRSQLLAALILGAFAALLIGYLWFAGGSAQNEKDFAIATEQFNNFQHPNENAATTNSDDKALAALTTLLNKQPELQAKYDAPVAQTLIDRGDALLAMPFAESALKRVSKDNLPYYVDYAKITLLIAQGDYDIAIKSSLSLKEKMIADLAKYENDTESKKSFGGYLFAFNLLRLAFLQQQVGAVNAEMKSWDEWKAYLGLNSAPVAALNIDRKPFVAVSKLFNDGSISLEQYIDMRQQQLMTQQEKP